MKAWLGLDMRSRMQAVEERTGALEREHAALRDLVFAMGEIADAIKRD